MLKSITLLICLILFGVIGHSQELHHLSQSPGEITQVRASYDEFIDSQYKVDWREKSIGLFFMPTPLNIESIVISGSKDSRTIGEDDTFFNVGFGISFNYDFNESGSGLGNTTYFAVVLGTGESNLQAYDFFTAIKYDVNFGPLSRFELSPLIGVGNLAFVNDKESLYMGNSIYVSGGARVSWLAVKNLYVGADIQTNPIILDPQKLLGVKGQLDTFLGEIDSAKIKYSFFAQVNLSIRYNIF